MDDRRIAVMGAGLSGLACAYGLEQNGIKPDIYEKRREVEDRFINLEAMMGILSWPVTDCFAYFADEYGLHLQPLQPIKQLEFISEKSHAVIESHLGYITARGRHPQALGKQLASKIKSRIIYKSKKTYEDLIKEYDIIVLATGDGTYSRNLQRFSTDVSVKLLGMTIKGHFHPNKVTMFLNNRFAPSGYVYLLPYDEENANLVIATPVNDADMNRLKEILLNEINFSGRITDEFQIKGYVIGRPEKLRLGNTYFTGNCGGGIMPFLGFGQFSSIFSGLQAAKCICQNLDYENEMKLMQQSYKYALILRRTMEDMDNHAYDRLVSALKGSLGVRLFTSKRINFLKYAARMAAPYAVIKKVLFI